MKVWAVLVQYSLVSTFIWQYQHHAGFMMVVGQDSLSGGDFCRMAIRIYETIEQCVRVQPHSSIGYFYPDGQCRSIVRDTPLNASIVYLEEPGDPANLSASAFFPGNYRAECTSDGESIRFIESGCRSDQCSPSTNGICESGDSEIALAYSGGSFLKFPIGGDWSCPFTATANFSFIIQGDCSKPGCMVNGVLNPLPTTGAPVVVVATDSPTILTATTGAPAVTPTDSPTIMIAKETPTTDSPSVSTETPVLMDSPTDVPVADSPTIMIATETPSTGSITSSPRSTPVVAIVVGVVGTILGLAAFLLIYKLALSYWMFQHQANRANVRPPFVPPPLHQEDHRPIITDSATAATTSLPSTAATTSLPSNAVPVVEVLEVPSLQDWPYFKDQTRSELPHANPVP